MCKPNFYFNYILFFAILLGGAAYSQCPLDLNETTSPTSDDLLLHFPFDGSLDNLGDPTYSATMVGGAYTAAACDNGVTLDGDDDYILVSPNPNLDDDYTVTAWINPNNQFDPMGIFSIRDQCATSYRGYSKVEFGIGVYSVDNLSNQINKHIDCTGWSAGDRYTNDAAVIPNMEFTFVAVTVVNNNSEGRIVKLYLNCQEYTTVMTLDFPTDVCFSPTIDYLTTIGATSSIAGQTNTFDGIIDELRVYDEVLTHDELLDIYRGCSPLSLTSEKFTNCSSDSAVVTLYNTELDVDYQLYDITNDVFVGSPLSGICGDLTFYTDAVDDTTLYKIVATNVVSDCSIDLDSIIVLFPINEIANIDSMVNLCFGDSVLIDGSYYTEEGVYSDTISIDEFCDSIINYVVSVEEEPAILINVVDTVGCYPLDVSFSDESVFGDITEWLWDFGDGATSFLENPIHEYTEPGPFWVTLNLTNSNGCMNSDSVSILSPSLHYLDSTENISLCNGDSVLIDGVYESVEGTYLDTVVAGLYCDTVITYNITVNEELNVDFNHSVQNNCLPVLVDFIDSTTVITGGESWNWFFGDGYTSTLQNPEHEYINAGTYDVTLQVTTTEGCSYSITKSITITGSISPEANFSFVPLNPEISEPIFFTDESINTTAWFWTFGDGESSSAQHPTHTYTSEATYPVKLLVTNGDCRDSIIYRIGIDLETLFYVPNSFTPDGDNFNDQFKPVFTSGFDPYNYHLTIMNRWGEIVFESYNSTIGWNGAYNGSSVQDGTYLWRIEFGRVETDQILMHIGHVNVLK